MMIANMNMKNDKRRGVENDEILRKNIHKHTIVKYNANNAKIQVGIFFKEAAKNRVIFMVEQRVPVHFQKQWWGIASDFAFNAWAVPAVTDIQGVRDDCYILLAERVIVTMYAPCIFCINHEDGAIIENVESCGYTGARLTILISLWEKEITKAAVYISHQDLCE